MRGTKTVMERMNAEDPDKMLAELEAKHGSVQRIVRRFRCIASRFRLDDPPRNPFLVRLENFGPGKTTTRTFEFDAADESECRRLFKEAQEQGVSNVVGFTLDRIEEVAPNAEVSHPSQRGLGSAIG